MRANLPLKKQYIVSIRNGYARRNHDRGLLRIHRGKRVRRQRLQQRDGLRADYTIIRLRDLDSSRGFCSERLRRSLPIPKRSARPR